MPRTRDTSAQLPVGLISYETAGKGNCFFYSIMAELKKLPQHTKKSDEQICFDLRWEIASYMAENRTVYAPFLGDEGGFENHLAHFIVQKDQQWQPIDYPHIYALAQILRRPIVIIGGNRQPHVFLGLDDFTGEPLFVYYKERMHYQTVECTTDRSTGEILQELQKASQQTQWRLENTTLDEPTSPSTVVFPTELQRPLSPTEPPEPFLTLGEERGIELTSNLVHGPVLITVSEKELRSKMTSVSQTASTYREFGNRAIILTEKGIYYFFYQSSKERSAPNVAPIFHIDQVLESTDGRVKAAKGYLNDARLTNSLTPAQIILEAIRKAVGMTPLSQEDQRTLLYSSGPILHARLEPAQYELMTNFAGAVIDEELYGTETNSLIQYLLVARGFRDFLGEFSGFFERGYTVLVVNNFPQVPPGSLELLKLVEGINTVRKMLVMAMRSAKKPGRLSGFCRRT